MGLQCCNANIVYLLSPQGDRGLEAERADPEVADLRAELRSLAAQLTERDRQQQRDEVADAERDVKEEAMKRAEVMSVDTLHQKLVRLEDLARRANHPKTEKFWVILQRFTYYKNLPNVGQLILDLMSTQQEAAVFERERKFLKKSVVQAPQNVWPNVPPQQWQSPASGYAGHPSFGHGQGFRGQYSGQASSAPYTISNPRGNSPRAPNRRPPSMSMVGKCYRCKQPGHFIKDCPMGAQ